MNLEQSDNTTILIADDDSSILELLSGRLSLEGFRVDTVADGKQALERIKNDPPDLVILGLYLPYLGGLTILESIRQTYENTELPVIILVERDNREDLALALSKGANDCLSKPINFDTTLARIDTQLQLMNQYERIQALLQTDPESGLFNRDFLIERLDEELARLNRYGGELTVMTISFVSSRGEVDRPLLRSLASTLQATCRSSDILGRLADNRFGLLLTETDPVNSVHVKRRLKQALNEAGLTETLVFSIEARDERDYEETTAAELLGTLPDHEPPGEPEPSPVKPLPEVEPSETAESVPVDEERSRDPFPDPEELPLETVVPPELERSEPENELTRESWFDNLLDVILMENRKRERDNS